MFGRFLCGIAALIWNEQDNTYLILRRSRNRNVGAGNWDCITGRVRQGESYESALHREVGEEIGLPVRIEYVIGTTHFYRGNVTPDNELLGVAYCCTLLCQQPLQLSSEHEIFHWVTVQEAKQFLSTTQWLLRMIEQAHSLNQLISPEQRTFYRTNGFNLSP